MLREIHLGEPGMMYLHALLCFVSGTQFFKRLRFAHPLTSCAFDTPGFTRLPSIRVKLTHARNMVGSEEVSTPISLVLRDATSLVAKPSAHLSAEQWLARSSVQALFERSVQVEDRLYNVTLQEPPLHTVGRPRCMPTESSFFFKNVHVC